MPRRNAERDRRRRFEDAVAQVLEGDPPDDDALNGAGIPARWRRRTRVAAEAVKAGKADPRAEAERIAAGAFEDGAGPAPHPGHARANAALQEAVRTGGRDTRHALERIGEARHPDSNDEE